MRRSRAPAREIETLVTQAYQQDEAEEAALGAVAEMNSPPSCPVGEALFAIEAAMRRLEAQAKAEADAERQHRADADAERRRTGKRRQQAPKLVDETPADDRTDQFH